MSVDKTELRRLQDVLSEKRQAHEAVKLRMWNRQKEYEAELRKKLEADSAQPRFVLTEPGVGYRLREGNPGAA